MRRIVVTGLGAVSPLGCGVELIWSRLLAGQSGLRALSEKISADLGARIAGLVPDKTDDADGGFDPDAVVARKDQRKMDRFILFAMVAAAEAIARRDASGFRQALAWSERDAEGAFDAATRRAEAQLRERMRERWLATNAAL